MANAEKLQSEVKEAMDAVRRLLNKYAKSGVSDSEGMWSVRNWFVRGLMGRPQPTVTFEYLEGYTMMSDTEIKKVCGGMGKAEIASVIAAAMDTAWRRLDEARGLVNFSSSDEAADFVERFI